MRRSLTVLTTALALGLAACGGGEAEGPPAAESAAGELTLVGNDSVQWVGETDVTAEAVDGSIDITLVCEGVVPHNLNIEGVQDAAVLAECAGNDEETVNVAIEPGTYDYYCSVPGHREAGMEGTLTVS